MHCDQCGKENRPKSKFCRFCANALSENSQGFKEKKVASPNISWKSPIILLIFGLVVLVGFGYGSSKAYAYYQVESKINTAKKLQTAGDYKGSIEVLNGWENKTLTNDQKTRIESIKTDNQKFIGFKESFDSAVTIENSTSTSKISLSAGLQDALKDLQSIDSSYPDFKNVQTEMTKVQNALVVSLQTEADVSKKAATDASALAERNRQAAASAQAAKDRAESNAQQAQSAADSATANAAAQAEVARSAEVRKSFYGQLLSAYNNIKNGDIYYTQAMNYYNAGNNSSAIVVFAKANAVYNEVSQTATNLNSNFSGLPQSYVDAANNLVSGASYNIKATNSALDSMSGGSTYVTTNYYSNLGDQYRNLVGSFIRSYSSN